jgi:hypothetical protein
MTNGFATLNPRTVDWFRCNDETFLANHVIDFALFKPAPEPKIPK